MIPPAPLHPAAPLPIVQAPMAGAQGVRLARAVAAAGGIGSLPAAMLAPAALAEALAALAADRGAAYNVNFFCHRPPAADPARSAGWRAALAPYYAEAGLAPPQAEPVAARHPFDATLAELLQAHPPAIVSFHFGLPEPALLARVRALGCQVWSSATTLDEARWLLDQGVDALIVQGLEAGGHRGHFLRADEDLAGQAPLAELLGPVLALAGPVPVIAAGGLAKPDQVRAVLARGTRAAQVGSAYLRCPEADTSPLHRAALDGPGAADTALTPLFTGRPARGIVNRLMRELGGRPGLAPAFPLAATDLAPLRAAAEARGSTDFTPLWSGTGASGAPRLDAAALTRWLAGEVALGDE